MLAAIELPAGFWIGILSHLWQTTIVLAVLSALALAMRRAPARFLNALWWIGLAKLLVPFQLAVPVLERAIGPIAARAQAVGVRLEGVTVWFDRAAPVLDPAARAGPGISAVAGSLGALLVALWSIGAVLFVASWMRARGRSPLRNTLARRHLPSRLRARLDASLAGTRIPPSAISVIGDRVMPATVGLFRRRIVVPEVLIERLDAQELRAVLLHEDAHRRRFEPLQVAVQRAAAAAFYFFPLVWPLLSRVRDTSEMACDEAAVREGVAPPDYARALARTLSIGLEPLGFAAALAHGAPSLTRRRLERLTHEGRFVVMRKHWLCLAVAALAVIAISASGVTLLADEGEAVSESEKEMTKEKAKDVAKAIAKGVAKGIAKEGLDAEGLERAVEAEQEAAAEKAAAEEPGAAEEETYALTLVHHPNPEYPEDAKEDGVGGRVVLELTISSEGAVTDVVVIEGVEGYPSLAESAETAVREWTFEIEGDVDGELEVIVPIEFKLHGPNTKELSVTVPDAHPKPDEPPATEEAPEPPAPPAADETPEPNEPPKPPDEP